jgi:hypothetical protein
MSSRRTLTPEMVAELQQMLAKSPQVAILKTFFFRYSGQIS